MTKPVNESRSMSLLGTRLQLTTYPELASFCAGLSLCSSPFAIEFANTQIVAMRRHSEAFRQLTDCYDYFIPDGMPLIWCLNWKNAGLKDRVYGPTFMRYLLSQDLHGCTHYLVGGSEECGRRLRERILNLNPKVQIVGSFHGKCDESGIFENGGECQVIEEIRAFEPDFIWVGLGTPKQQAWIQKNKSKLKKGVILGVGFAFDVNAGTKRDAPLWMQGLGLTWMFRMCSEPTRLVPRYLRYNSMFIFYLLWDAVRGKVFEPVSNDVQCETKKSC